MAIPDNGEPLRCYKCDTFKLRTREFFYYVKGFPQVPCRSCRLAPVSEEDAARRSEKHRKKYADNPEYAEHLRRKASAHRNANIDKVRAQERARRSTNAAKALDREWRISNKDMINSQQREKRALYPDRFRQYYLARYAHPRNRLSAITSARIKKVLSNRGWSDQGAMRHLDWTILDLQKRLLDLFEVGMSLENAGEWHIDHIRPIASFDFISPDDDGFKQAWSLTNLAPLWAADNISKRDCISWHLPDTYKNQRLREAYVSAGHKA